MEDQLSDSDMVAVLWVRTSSDLSPSHIPTHTN
jgi:hypothetical protein